MIKTCILVTKILLGCMLTSASSQAYFYSDSQLNLTEITAHPWPEADALFHRDSRWLGGDDAYSIDLGHGRVLWLFADSFIATSVAHSRSEAKIIRNSVAIQKGYDPSAASIKFYWKGGRRNPASFFGEQQDEWYWPGHGIRLENKLIIFLMKVRKVETGLGFEVFGWRAVSIENPDDEPSAWKIKTLETPKNDYRVIIGSASILRDENHLYAFSAQETSGHNVFIVRWPINEAANDNLQNPQWWISSSREWVRQQELKELPAPVLTGAQTEFTVHFDSKRKQFLQIQTVGFGAADLAIRRAKKMTGDWSEPEAFYRPVESNRSDTFIYAGKAHAELRGADLVLTYVVNSNQFAKLVGDGSIYYPRFLKGRFHPQR